VARVIEHSARIAEDAERMSLNLRDVSDLVREADYWAGESAHEHIDRADVQRAIDERITRSDRVREHLHEEIRRGTLLIDTEGDIVGQINGLSVMTLGDFAFGQPVRITATTRIGDGEMLDIERETELGGPIHSKGVMILGSFLGSRYATDTPLSMSGSLVFEQSYGFIEGDSASLAELCALLSSLAAVPIRQCYALTGSVNQRGQVQPIGGVNEKIEGFFDVCRTRGLTGSQGVVIPTSNSKHLMLRHDVVAAVAEGTFQVAAVENVDQAMTLLTGLQAGERGADGHFPPDSINGRVDHCLAEFASTRARFRAAAEDDEHVHEHEHTVPTGDQTGGGSETPVDDGEAPPA
jgi:predicted ATP-dependent protease